MQPIIVYSVLLIACMLAAVWLILNFIFRVGKLFSRPQNSQRSNHLTRKTIRKIYFRPISPFARLTKVRWNIDIVDALGGEVVYVNDYFFPSFGLGANRMIATLDDSLIMSADCLVDFGAIYPFRFYLDDGNVVDFIKERETLDKLTPVIIMDYKQKLNNFGATSFMLGLLLSVAYICITLSMMRINPSTRFYYPEYWYWLLLLGLDILIIFQPWLFFLGRKKVYSYQEFREKSNLISSNFIVDYPNFISIVMTRKDIDKPDYLFVRDINGLISDSSCIDVKHNIPLIFGWNLAIGAFPAMLMSFVFITKMPMLFLTQLVLYISAWVITIKANRPRPRDQSFSDE